MSDKKTNEDRQLPLNFEQSGFPEVGTDAIATNVFHIASFRFANLQTERRGDSQSSLSSLKKPTLSSEETIIQQVLAQAKHLSW